MQLDLMRQTAIRWADPDAKHVPLLREGGITLVLTSSNEPFRKACADAGIQVVGEASIQFLTLADAAKSKPGVPAAFTDGLWPGVQRPDPATASATRTLWMDQNCSLPHYIRALFPAIPPVLAYKPAGDPKVIVPFESLELALVDAWVSGGNYLMSMDPRYREGLLKGDADALKAWRKLGVTAKWLRANESLFRKPALPLVTMLVDDQTQDFAHLAFRHSVSPALVRATDPPTPDPAQRRVLIAASIAAPEGTARTRILAHAEAGTTLVVEEGAWWKTPALKQTRSDGDRNYYSLGKGQVVAYKDSLSDPGAFALDVVDIVTQKLRPARIWNCNAGLVMATAGTLHVLNYGRMVDLPVLARLQGKYTKAKLLRPDAEPTELKVSPRGTSSEVEIPSIDKVATVLFG